MGLALAAIRMEIGLGQLAILIIACALVIGCFKYRAAINSRIKKLEESSLFGKPQIPFRMIRIHDMIDQHDKPRKLKLLSLNQAFLEKNKESERWGHLRMISLGDYMSTIRPNLVEGHKISDFIETELQNALTAILLKVLGPMFGTAVLPALGLGSISNMVTRFAGGATNYILSDQSNKEKLDSATSLTEKRAENFAGGSLPLTLSAMTYIAEANYQKFKNISPENDFLAKHSAKNENVTKNSLQKLHEGEVGFSPSFSEKIKSGTAMGEALVPNPFILTSDWNAAIEGMESLLQTSENFEWKSTPMETNEGTVDRSHCYNPNSRKMKRPRPLYERLFPDLHLGWGDALCTHTEIEVLKNRLICVLLNKLAYNYQCFSTKEKPFVVQVTKDGAQITKPAGLMQALIDMGHSVEACIRTHLTTFGVSLCVKENDGTFTNIPLAYFFQNGFVDSKGQDAYNALPHTGLNVEIRQGPLLQKGSIQHFISIEGLCGWHSNHNADVPWLKDTDCGPTYYNKDSLDVFTVAGLESNVFGEVATKLQLPKGGYGLTGVCNDSAALVEYALTGQTNVYPLTFNGRFAMQILRYAVNLRAVLEQSEQVTKDEIKAIDGLIKAIKEVRSDLNSLPSEAGDQIRRQMNCLPDILPFELMKQTKEVLSTIEQEITETKQSISRNHIVAQVSNSLVPSIEKSNGEQINMTS